ncbi:hypothetical protein [Dongia sedimenti]|uniref:DNA-binding protein n=1 Tax=Dongia sedimenti TaxID=3064282 RepID=A0ABU0YXJ4_9PROT|nr:hypothetical protein [Rhodospirillaceae bacterium R-7]
MSKIDRIPDAWPAQMSDVLASRYCDLSLSQFLAMVKKGQLPPGRKIGGTRLVRWHRRRLDEALNDMHGLDDPEDPDEQENEWLLRVRGITKPPRKRP